MVKFIRIVMLFAFAGRFGGESILAQNPRQPSPSASVSQAGAADASQKAKILASDAWRKVLKEFDEWLSLQVVYTPQQVARMKAKLTSEVQRMSAAELQQFLDQWDAKLKVLLGRDAGEVREWLGQYLSVVADGYRAEFLKKLGITDVTKLTAAQIEEELARIRAERLQFQQQRTFFDASREATVKNADQIRAAENVALQESGQGKAAEIGTYQTPYSPRHYDYRPLPPIIPFWW